MDTTPDDVVRSCTSDDLLASALRDLKRAREERDEYQDQVHVLTERVRNMTNAASNAAATATVAIGRLEVAEEVAKAAEKFIDDPKSLNAIFALHEKVLAWQARKPS